MPLNGVLDSEVITRLKQNRRVVYENTIQNRVYTNYILVYLWFYLVRNVVINGVSHVLWKDISKPFLVEHIVIEDFNYYIQQSLVFIGIETDFEDFVRLGTLYT